MDVGEEEACVVGAVPLDGDVVCAVANAVPAPNAPPNAMQPTTTRPIRLVMLRISLPSPRTSWHGDGTAPE